MRDKNKKFGITSEYEDNILLITVNDEPYNIYEVLELLQELDDENKKFKQERKKILDIINNKITKLGMDWYKAENNSREEKVANIQLNVLEELCDELKEISSLLPYEFFTSPDKKEVKR